MNKAKIIILNGTSSAGKTSIAKALQKQMHDCYLHFQMDVFWEMVPEHIEANSENFPYLKESIIDSAYALAKKNHNLIMDIVFMPEQLKSLKEKLKEFEILTFAITASLEVTEQRERQRKDRKNGLARSQYDHIHKNTSYDLIIDTTHHNFTLGADTIIKHLNA